MVKSRMAQGQQISCVIHPDAHGLVVTVREVFIRTRCGAPGYQLGTGEIIEI